MRSSIKILIGSVLILVSAFSFGIPKASADVIGGIGSFLGCSAGGIGGGYVAGLIEKGISELGKSIPGLGALGGIIGGSGAVPVTDEKLIKKETRSDVLARCAARELLSSISGRSIEIARTNGRDGGATWITNWRNLSVQGQNRGEGIFRAILSNTNLCPHLSSDVKSLFGANSRISLGRLNIRVGDLQPFTTSAACTMPRGFSLEKYSEDFAGNGGWAAFSRLVEPQNNMYGILNKSIAQLGQQVAIEQAADANEASAGQGFLGTRGTSACLLKSNNTCIMYADVKTPGSILAGSVNNANKAELDWIVSSDEISELIATGVEILFNRMRDLSNPNEGDYVIPGEINLPTPTTPTPTGPVDGVACVTNSFKGSESTILGHLETIKATAKNSVFPSGPAFTSISFLLTTLKGERAALIDADQTGAIESIESLIISIEDLGSFIFQSTNKNSASFQIQIDNYVSALKTEVEALADLDSCFGVTPPGGEPASLLSAIQTERAKYGNSVTLAQLGTLLNTVAWNNRDAGWGLSRKTGGNKCPSPVGDIACDVLHHQPTNTLYDVFVGATNNGPGGETIPGPADPTWSNIGPPQSADRVWVAPVQP